MSYRTGRGLVMVSGVVALLLGAPSESIACCGWLFGGGGARTTYSLPYVARSYAPVYSAPACTTCVPQTVSYVPQTSYRTVYRSVPVTSYYSAAGCDPCTGCPVTYHRPVTTWTYRATVVPYTAYRGVYSDPCSPYVSYDVCSPCGPGAASTLAAPGSCCIPSSPAATGTPTPKTFQDGGESTDESIEPEADPSTSSTPVPNLIDPGTRTTSWPAPRTARYRPAGSSAEPASNGRVEINDGGWRVARD